jgi:hypothetical protein
MPASITAGPGGADLSSYGQWVSSPECPQSQCWTPTQTEPEWRPYYYGYWHYDPRYGWIWVSSEPWGYLPYHYGSWTWSGQYGWMWVPGSTWSGAWVVFVDSPDYIGWAPRNPHGKPCTTDQHEVVYQKATKENLDLSAWIFTPKSGSIGQPITLTQNNQTAIDSVAEGTLTETGNSLLATQPMTPASAPLPQASAKPIPAQHPSAATIQPAWPSRSGQPNRILDSPERLIHQTNLPQQKPRGAVSSYTSGYNAGQSGKIPRNSTWTDEPSRPRQEYPGASSPVESERHSTSNRQNSGNNLNLSNNPRYKLPPPNGSRDNLVAPPHQVSQPRTPSNPAAANPFLSPVRSSTSRPNLPVRPQVERPSIPKPRPDEDEAKHSRPSEPNRPIEPTRPTGSNSAIQPASHPFNLTPPHPPAFNQPSSQPSSEEEEQQHKKKRRR